MLYISFILNFCSIISSILFVLLYIPQIKRIYTTNNTKSFSLNYLKISLFAYIFYIIYCFISHLYVLFISSIINTLFILYFYYKKIKNIKYKIKYGNNEYIKIETIDIIL